MVSAYLLAFVLLATICKIPFPVGGFQSRAVVLNRRNGHTLCAHQDEYVAHWDNLLQTEYDYTARELLEQRKNWSRRRLENAGISVFGAVAEPDTELFGEKIVRIIKPGDASSRFRDFFTRGDVLLITPTMATVDPMPRECLVVECGQDWLTVGVGSSWLPGLWESRKTVGAYQVRLDRTAPQAPLRAQRGALNYLRKGQAGGAANLMVESFHDITKAEDLASKTPSRFKNLSPDQVIELIEGGLDRSKQNTSFRPNQSQQDAIVWALQRTISLIRGPPGTGKTRTAALLISAATRLKVDNHSTGRVLAVTHSNGAADVLLEALLAMGVPAIRYGRPATVSPMVQHRTVIAMAEKMPQVVALRRKATNAQLDKQRRGAALYDLRQSVVDAQRLIVTTAPVVVTSCIGAYQLLIDEEKDATGKHNFDTVVVDESAQTTEPALLCALAAARPDQLVLVGDTRQLPPTITCNDVRDTLGISPMTRLEQAGVGEVTLRVQYRMDPALLEHPSKYFYNGLVKSAQDVVERSQSNRLPLGFSWPSSDPLAVVRVGNGDSEIRHNFGGRSNPSEAEVVASIVLDLLDEGDVEASGIAVISPYSKQVQLIRNKLAATTLSRRSMIRNSHNVRVGTVDSFQGQEADLVIFSSVRSNPMRELGFLRDSRRLCVSITRAKRGFILVGDTQVLRSCRHWNALLESCERRDYIVDVEDLNCDDESTSTGATMLMGKEGVDDVDLLFTDASWDELSKLFAPDATDVTSPSSTVSGDF